jgi:hypothetical protein
LLEPSLPAGSFDCQLIFFKGPVARRALPFSGFKISLCLYTVKKLHRIVQWSFSSWRAEGAMPFGLLGAGAGGR